MAKINDYVTNWERGYDAGWKAGRVELIEDIPRKIAKSVFTSQKNNRRNYLRLSKEGKMSKCKLCLDKCDGKLVIVSAKFCMKDGSEISVCKTCFNLYANQQFDELTKRIEAKEK